MKALLARTMIRAIAIGAIVIAMSSFIMAYGIIVTTENSSAASGPFGFGILALFVAWVMVGRQHKRRRS